jgi:hypothetical protein
MTDKQRKIMKLADEILELVDSAEYLTRSDLEGGAMAIAMKVISSGEEGKVAV